MRSGPLDYRLGSLRLEVTQRRLLAGEDRIPLTPKVFDLLCLLVRHPGQLLTKERFFEALWPGLAVSEANLKQNVGALRRALEQAVPESASWIENVPRAGYRWVGPAEPIEPGPGSPGEEATGNDEGTPSSAGFFRGRARWYLASLGLAIVVVAGFTARPGPSPPQTGAVPGERSEVESLLARGRFFWNQRTSTGLGKSMALFERAAALAPLDPRVHEAMADACAFDLARASEAEEHIGKALRLAAGRAHPHATRGFVALFSRSDLAAAGRSLRRALELDRADLSAHQWMAWWHAVQGQHVEARDEIERALALDPVSLPVLTDRVKLAYLADVPVLAIELSREALELDPRRAGVHEALARIHAHARRWDEWLEAETARRSAEGEGDTGLARLRSAYAAGGPEAVLRPPPEFQVAGAGMRYARALAYSWLGEPESALDELRRGVEESGFGLLEALADPEFSTLRGSPRFEALRARLLGSAPGLSGR